jgi:isopenicillin N synthase-like dioxygenase
MKNICELEDIPIIDVQAYFDKTPGKYEEECRKVAQSFHQFGIILFKDPRVEPEHNEEYLNMIEKYFEQTGKKYYAGEPLKDMRPELNYQTGVTPESTEKAKNH